MFINLRTVFSYKKTFSNWVTVILKTIKGDYPFTAYTKGGPVIVKGHTPLYFLTRNCYTLTYTNEGALKIKYKDIDLSFYGALNNGELYEVFINESYSPMRIKNSTVIDIGGNIGDTAIYFALNGAEKVYAMEPQIRSYNSLIKNIEVNHLGNIIHPMLAASGASDSEIFVANADENPTGGNSLRVRANGQRLKFYSLKSIAEEFATEHTALKIDCEGCEYDIIRFSDNSTLRLFEEIVIEYHFGVKSLYEKLISAGFKIHLEKGMRGFNTKSKPHFMNTGMLFCKRV